MKEAALALGLTAVLAVVVVLTVSAAGDGEPEPFVMPTAAPATPEATVDPNASGAELGEQVANQAGCLACHTTDGSEGAGPTWQGLFGHEVPLNDGSTVIADAEYIRQSILEPASQVVEGFQPIMPATFGDTLSEEQIDALIAYIESLS